MGLFSKKSDWEETFRINAIGRGGRGFCSVMFWIWGLGGPCRDRLRIHVDPERRWRRNIILYRSPKRLLARGHGSFRTRGNH